MKRRLAVVVAVVLLTATSSACAAQGGRAGGTADSGLREFLNRLVMANPDFTPADVDSSAHFTVKYAAAAAPLRVGLPPVEVVHMVAPTYWCGTGGCHTLIISRENGTRRVVADIGVTRLPISVLPDTSHGWHDIRVFAAGGLAGRNGYDTYRFDGSTYKLARENEPLDSAKRATVVIPKSAPLTQLYPQ